MTTAVFQNLQYSLLQKRVVLGAATGVLGILFLCSFGALYVKSGVAASFGIAALLVSLADICAAWVLWIVGSAVSAFSALLYFYSEELKRRYRAIHYELWVRYTCSRRYRHARKLGRPLKTMLIYPALPKYYYALYTICHQLGYGVTSDPSQPYDAAFYFKDVTTRGKDPVEDVIRKKTYLINGSARDISKEKVEEIFSEVFGYSTFVDPRTFRGECVQKSSENATHNGKVVRCPREPAPGYIYQKLINNQDGDRVSDIRIKICGQNIPFATYRTRSVHDRFDNTETATVVPVEKFLTPDEIRKVLAFSDKLGLDFGALDCLRDRDDGKLYIVDANLTIGSPQPGIHFTYDEYELYIQKFSDMFEKAFMNTDADSGQAASR